MSGEVRGVELLVLKDLPSRKDPHSGKKIRLVQWIFATDKGYNSSVKLEKRSYFQNDAGEDRIGKAEGFGLTDLEALRPKWKEIIEMMKNPPPVSELPPKTDNKAGDLEEVPF